ncbi:hypothetical protein E2C01_081504 [Portunus trituberculatus]|uniref:Uncharacterized protein n=1 Tax=Portunus trituberculatus TaxID=210409 RepID=A0A5B7J1B6_PORTR|nr:hypothetical protein [Portunus trituberculatus]
MFRANTYPLPCCAPSALQEGRRRVAYFFSLVRPRDVYSAATHSAVTPEDLGRQAGPLEEEKDEERGGGGVGEVVGQVGGNKEGERVESFT